MTTRASSDRSAEATVRAEAPIEGVWSVAGSLEQVLAHSLAITEVYPNEDGTTARLRAEVGVGPVEWRFDARAEVVESSGPDRLVWNTVAPRYGIELRSRIELESPTPSETVIRCSVTGTMRVRGSLHRRMWAMLAVHLDTYVDRLARDLARKAEQHAGARQALGRPREEPR